MKMERFRLIPEEAKPMLKGERLIRKSDLSVWELGEDESAVVLQRGCFWCPVCDENKYSREDLKEDCEHCRVLLAIGDVVRERELLGNSE